MMDKIVYGWFGFETLIYFIFVALSVIIGAIVQFFACIFLFPLLYRDKYFIHKIGNKVVFNLIHYTVFYMNRHWKCVILTDLPKRDPKKRRLFMFNHLSIGDPFVSTFLGKNFFTGCLYKDSIQKGYPKFLLDLIGQIPIYFQYDSERGVKTVKKECVAGVMARCKELMDNGFDLIVYPEGTRSKTGKLQEFKDGFFRFAIENDYEIVPCAVHNTYGFLTKHIIVQKETAYLMVGSPISPKGKKIDGLKSEVRKAIYKLVKMSPKFNPKLEAVPELE